MPSQIEIVNRALLSIGAEPVLNLDEETKAARAMKLLWPSVLMAMCAEPRFGFATSRASLSRLSDTPEYGFKYKYALPLDCLFVVEIYGEGQDSRYRVEGGDLLTDADAVSITYLASITHAGKIPILFAEALIARLAAEGAYAITQSLEVERAAWDKYQRKWMIAKNQDIAQGTHGQAGSKLWSEARR